MKIQASGENYLETILLLEQCKGFVRSIDIANELDYTKPSISRAMGILKEAGYIEMIEGAKSFSPKRDETMPTHQRITAFLRDTLNLSPEIAQEDACHFEHVVSGETMDAMRIFMAGKDY